MRRWRLYWILRTPASEMRMVPLVDSNNDGVISRKELETSLKNAGVSWALLKSCFAMISVDRNGNGVIDGSEIQGLVDYAHQHWKIDLAAQPVAAA